MGLTEMVPPLFYGPWRAAPSLVKLTDVLSRRGTPTYLLESHLPRGGDQVEQEVGAKGCAPHPRAPCRMPPLSWTDWNTKPTMKVVSPCTAPPHTHRTPTHTVHHEGRWPERATGRAQRGWDLGAESWASGADRGAEGPRRRPVFWMARRELLSLSPLLPSPTPTGFSWVHSPLSSKLSL